MKKINQIIYPVAAVLAMSFAPAAVAQDSATEESNDTLKVNMPFRTANATDVLGGVSTVNVEELQKKSYTTYSLENMQSLVTGYNGELWDMGDALVLVDGVPRDANNVIPAEIESITFLKGAQAVVIYGSTASKGAILIKTKRGNAKGLEVDVRADVSLFVPKSYPKYLGSVEYMSLYNEARRNDGLDPAFSVEDIYRYSSGSNPFRYPDINFFSDDYIKKNYQRYEAQAQFRGGGKYASFYALVGIYHTTGMMNFGEGKKNGTTRLNVRGNIDLNLNDWVSGWINTSATFYDDRSDRSNFWAESATMRPTIPGSSPLVPLIPLSAIEQNDENSWLLANNSRFIVGGKYLLGGTQNYQTNTFAAMYAAGYNKYTSRNLQFDAGLKIDFNKVAPGLSFTARGAVDYSTIYNTTISNRYATYEATWTNYDGKDVINTLTKYGDDLSTGTQEISGSWERQTLMFSGQFDYVRTFNDVHNLEAMLVAHGYKRSITGEYHHNTNFSTALRAAYNYANRYYAEFNGALNHSSKFAPGHRDGFSPVGSLGWRIGQEDFMKDVTAVDELRLNVTYGQLLQDIDIERWYLWDNKFTADGDYWGWNNGMNSNQSFESRQGENPDLTFVKRRELNIGLDGSFWNGTLAFSAAFFRTDIDGLPIKANNVYPSYLETGWPNSSFIPWINYNKRRVTGFDLGLSSKHSFGDFSYEIGFNIMYAYRKNVRISETAEYNWLLQTGHDTNALRGYKCLGFFQSEEEIANSAVINNNTKPGDLKYKDMNEDGVIDYRDQVELGSWNAPWTYGINLTLKYKGFTLFACGSGNAGGTGVMNNTYAWVYGDDKYSDIVRGRWTPETAETATYPRLTTQNGDLNFVTSDFWTYSTDAFYLNQIQLTYDFPSRWFEKKFVKGINIYINGNDLAMIGPNRKYRETNVGSMPQVRSYNFGVNVNF